MLRVSFDALRGLRLAQRFVKPDHWLNELPLLRAADVLLYPETCQVNGLHHVLRKTIFPNLASYRLGWDKIEMTRAFQLAVPDAVPPTLILPATPAAAEFPLAVEQVLQDGLKLRDRYAENKMSLHGLWTATGRLEARLDRLLARNWRDEENRKFANHLRHISLFRMSVLGSIPLFLC